MLEANTSYSFPEAWEEYLEPIPENERHDLMTAYHKRLNSDDEKTRVIAAKAWSKWEYVAPLPFLEVVNSDISVVCH
jgi:proline iminopeptidase